MIITTRRFPIVDNTKMSRYAVVLAISVAVAEGRSEPAQKLVLLNMAVWKNKANPCATRLYSRKNKQTNKNKIKTTATTIIRRTLRFHWPVEKGKVKSL